jgi:hypothetical protein
MTNEKRVAHPLIQAQPTIGKMHNGKKLNNGSFLKAF